MKGRNYSIDLLRIICMIFVVVLHINLFGGFNLAATQSDSFVLKFVVNLYEQLSIVAVNVFIIISSWFLLESQKVSLRKLSRLIAQMFFWWFVISLIAYFLGVRPSIYDIFVNFPLIGNSYDFISGYVVLYVIHPYLNSLVKGCKKIDFRVLSVLTIVLFSVLSPVIASDYLHVNHGYSISWFICIYVIVAYVKIALNWRHFNWEVYFSAYLILSIIGTIARCYSIFYFKGGYYNDPVIFVSSIMLFLTFASINVSNRTLTAQISFFAPLSVSCFFIHANPFIEEWYFSLSISSLFDSLFIYMLVVPTAASMIFVICVLCDKYIRLNLFNLIGLFKSKPFENRLFKEEYSSFFYY